MTLPVLIAPERVREVAEDVDGNYYDMGWSISDVGVKAIELAAPEIARNVLEMTAKRFGERNPGHIVTYGGVVSLLRQMAEEITDGN